MSFLFPISRVILNTLVLIFQCLLGWSLISARIVLGQWIVTHLDTPVNAHMSSNLDAPESQVPKKCFPLLHFSEICLTEQCHSEKKSWRHHEQHRIGSSAKPRENSRLVSWNVKKCSDTGKEC